MLAGRRVVAVGWRPDLAFVGEDLVQSLNAVRYNLCILVLKHVVEHVDEVRVCGAMGGGSGSAYP